jgi:hypothetical protein
MRHQWDQPAGSFERTCQRCPAVVRKYAGQGGYQFWPKGLDPDPRERQDPQWLQTIPECEPLLVPEADRFRYGQEVRINYNGNPVVPYRYGYVREDAGGPKVKVKWYAQKQHVGGPHGPRRILTHYPNAHVQWVPRQRLEAAA